MNKMNKILLKMFWPIAVVGDYVSDLITKIGIRSKREEETENFFSMIQYPEARGINEIMGNENLFQKNSAITEDSERFYDLEEEILKNINKELNK